MTDVNSLTALDELIAPTLAPRAGKTLTNRLRVFERRGNLQQYGIKHFSFRLSQSKPITRNQS